jgi:hypothetical protein
MKVVRVSALRTGHLYLPGKIPGTHCLTELSRIRLRVYDECNQDENHTGVTMKEVLWNVMPCILVWRMCQHFCEILCHHLHNLDNTDTDGVFRFLRWAVIYLPKSHGCDNCEVIIRMLRIPVFRTSKPVFSDSHFSKRCLCTTNNVCNEDWQ